MDDSPPPAYNFKDVPVPAYQQAAQSESDACLEQSTPQPPGVSQQPFSLFHSLLHTHQPIAIRKAGRTDLYLSSCANASPLRHVTIGLCGRDIAALHNGASAASPVVAMAFPGYFRPTEIRIAPGNASHESIRKDSAEVSYMSQEWDFEMCLPIGNGRRETFIWKHSTGQAGWKLMRVGTGEMLCVYKWAGWWNSLKLGNIGEFRWVSGEDWGPEVDLMVIITLLGMVEWHRKIRPIM